MSNSEKVRTVATIIGIIGAILGSAGLLLAIYEKGKIEAKKR